MSTLHVLIGSVARTPLGAPDGTLLLDLGPDHPTRAGLIELQLRLDSSAGHIEQADVRVGAMHRGVEKLFEVRDYRQALMLANRHDWQAPFAGELTVALAAEHLLAMQVPTRAVWLRMVLAEHARISSHLGFLGFLTRADLDPPADLGARGRALREDLRTTLQDLTGHRVHPMVTRIGGMAEDPDQHWLEAVVRVCAAAADHAAQLADLLRDRPELGRGVAPISPDTIRGYGLSGPLARASGVDIDLRRQHPYLAYDRIQIPAPQQSAGDARARLWQLTQEVIDSARIVQECAEELRDTPGPLSQPLPKVIKLPDTRGYVATEAPLGIAGAHLVSRGDNTPWRLHLRTPSFAHVSALPAILPGVAVADLEWAMASIGYVVGDIDR